MSNLRVLIIAQDPLARAGLAALLADRPGCTVVGQIAGEGDWLAELDVYRPEVVVWDSGWEADFDALADLSQTGIAVVVLLSDETQGMSAWLAGAQGLLRREVDPNRLAAAIEAVYRGLMIVDPALASALFTAREAAPALPLEELSQRELEVLQLLAEGLPNKTIARRLDISEHTVKFHVNAIMGKLGAQSRTEAAMRAARAGLILL